MAWVQRLADLAAVAQARYGKHLCEEQKTEEQKTVGPPPAQHTALAGPASPALDPSAAAPSEAGSAQHAQSREKIGDPSARPAPPEPHSPPEPCRDHLVPQGAWPTVKELFRRFGKDQCGAYAAALSFFSILSLVPVLVVTLAALAFLFQDPHQAMLRLQSLVGSILPGSGAQKTAQELLGQANVEKSVTTLIQTRGIAGAIGLLSLLWASLQIFVNAAPAMNAAFEVEETRSWIKLRLLAMGLLIGAGALFLVSLLPSSGPSFIRSLHIPWLGLPKHVPWYIDTLFWLVALAINSGMFALVYKFLPNARSSWRQAWVGGALAGVLWELAKKGFAFYLSRFAHYDKMYGTLGGLIILVLWIYYTAMILLLGAEAVSLYRDIQEEAAALERAAAPERPAPAPSPHRARA